jgi:uncharacterized YigZ family protein
LEASKETTDTYLTLKAPAEGFFKDRGSKFIALAHPVYSEDSIKSTLADIRKDYHDARHHCYAYRLGADLKTYRVNDDGEPSSSAGKPIYGQIQSKSLTNVLIVVVRYFGGTKLGVGGLINAYRTAAADALSNAIIIEKTVNDIYEINFSYEGMNSVMSIMKEEQLEQVDQEFDLKCRLVFSVRQSQAEQVRAKLEKISNLEIEFLRTT